MKIKLFTLPNILTLANLACGCAAIVYVGANYMVPGALNHFFWFIAAAALFDLLDGAAARATGQYSEIGKQLDSLADVVSFGVAPSMALLSIYNYSWPMPHGITYALGWGVFAVALFSALRLAKFNVDETQREEFTGLPTPAAALAVASLHWVWCGYLWFESIPKWTILVLAALVSYLLISPIRMFSLKFKSFGWLGNELRYTFLALSAVLIAVLGIGGVAAAVGLYVLLSTVRHIAGMRTAEKK